MSENRDHSFGFNSQNTLAISYIFSGNNHYRELRLYTRNQKIRAKNVHKMSKKLVNYIKLTLKNYHRIEKLEVFHIIKYIILIIQILHNQSKVELHIV